MFRGGYILYLMINMSCFSEDDVGGIVGDVGG